VSRVRERKCGHQLCKSFAFAELGFWSWHASHWMSPDSTNENARVGPSPIKTSESIGLPVIQEVRLDVVLVRVVYPAMLLLDVFSQVIIVFICDLHRRQGSKMCWVLHDIFLHPFLVFHASPSQIVYRCGHDQGNSLRNAQYPSI